MSNIFVAEILKSSQFANMLRF